MIRYLGEREREVKDNTKFIRLKDWKDGGAFNRNRQMRKLMT